MTKKKSINILIWVLIGIAGAISISGIALIRQEKISSTWLLVAFACSQLISYRFYSSWIAAKTLCIDSKRVTPAKKYNDGIDFVPTNRWVVFGHHFAAIAGPGPLIGPTLASQFGYLPGTLWILIGCVLAGAVQDMVILFSSIRRNGKSLGKMIEDEIGGIAGKVSLIGTLFIIIILISVLGLIVVKALAHSPWGSFTVLMTVPIAMLVGIYIYHIRPSGVLEGSIFGLILFLLAVYAGKVVHYNENLASIFNRDGKFLAFAIILYGFMASVLPVWLLLTPRDYLSSFLKIGTILLLAIALIIFRPEIEMPAITRFIAGDGPIFSGKIFPFLFITIGCGAISGFHSLVASGTTPKIISSETDIRLVGYGSMLIEGLVAMMAIIAACVLDPAIFFAINSPASALGSDIAHTIKDWGFTLKSGEMELLASQMGETSLYSRTGGAPSLAVGMAKIFSSAFGSNMLSIWYHFAIMFEAIFILTTLDAGTRVARFMFEDLMKFRDKKFHESKLAGIFSSFVVVAGWGYFLYAGVVDPNGGINILWPLFGLSNQMLAGIALTLATVIIYKNRGKFYCLVTLIPGAFVICYTTCGALEKVFSRNEKIGLLANINSIKLKILNGLIVGEKEITIAKKVIFNQQLVIFLTLFFLAILWIVLIEAIRKVFLTRKNPLK